MATAEIIGERVQRLPKRMQAEVLDFVEFLLPKAEREQDSDEDRAWPQLSLALAMRGLEDEEPGYDESDLR